MRCTKTAVETIISSNSESFGVRGAVLVETGSSRLYRREYVHKRQNDPSFYKGRASNMALLLRAVRIWAARLFAGFLANPVPPPATQIDTEGKMAMCRHEITCMFFRMSVGMVWNESEQQACARRLPATILRMASHWYFDQVDKSTVLVYFVAEKGPVRREYPNYSTLDSQLPHP